MKKSFCLPCFLLLFTTFLYGQDTTVAVAKAKYTFLNFSAGYYKPNLHSINASLKSLGYLPVNENFITYSVSTAYTVRRWLANTEFTVLLPNKTHQANNITTQFKGNNFGFSFGYAVIHKPGFRLYPLIGLETFYSHLRFRDDTPAGNMNTAINTPHNSSDLRFVSSVIDVRVQVEKLFEVANEEWDCPQSSRFLTVGARVGYYLGFAKSKGLYNYNQTLSDAPSSAMNGPYVKLVFGWGAKLRQLKWKK